MKILISILLSAFLLSACNNSSNENRIEDSKTIEDTTRVVEEPINKVSMTIEEQLKGGLLLEHYTKEAVLIKEDKLYFSFKFDLNSDGGGVPDTYGSYVNFNFEIGEQLSFPKTLRFEEKGFNEEVNARMELYEGEFELVVATEDVLIYHSLKPQRTFVLFKNRKKTSNLAYYFNGEEDPQINENNVYEVINNAYEGGEMVIEHSRSSIFFSAE